MTNTPHVHTTRRRFRFGLRTLLAVVTVAAVGSWGYWVAWPWWIALREQSELETALRQLRSSDPKLLAVDGLPKASNDAMQSTARGSNLYVVGKFIRTNASYCIVLTDRTSTGIPKKFDCEKLVVYRLQRAPRDYRPYQERDLSEFDHPTSGWVREIRYVDDFADFILGRPQDGRQFRYELIYSDPPAEPAAK